MKFLSGTACLFQHGGVEEQRDARDERGFVIPSCPRPAAFCWSLLPLPKFRVERQVSAEKTPVSGIPILRARQRRFELAKECFDRILFVGLEFGQLLLAEKSGERGTDLHDEREHDLSPDCLYQFAFTCRPALNRSEEHTSELQ